MCPRRKIAFVKTISAKTKLALVGVGYTVVLAFAAVELHLRTVMESNDPASVIAASGMYAAGDMLLEVFIAFLLMIPTFFLVWIGAQFEASYTTYSQILLAIGFSAPLAFGVLFWGSNYLPETIGAYSFLRLLWSPFILGLIGMSRLMAQFDRAKRLTSYALKLEGTTFCLAIATIVYSLLGHRQ
jgi:hypothetical protein